MVFTPTISPVMLICPSTNKRDAVENWITIEVFGLFSAKANGYFAIVALTIVLLFVLASRSGRSSDG